MKPRDCLSGLVVLGCLLFPTTAVAALYVLVRAADHEQTPGNPVPDQSVAQRASAVSLVGWYQFKSRRHRQEWIQAARAQGIPVQETSAAATRMQCRWTGSALTCHTE